jgi:hypothetical protein
LSPWAPRGHKNGWSGRLILDLPYRATHGTEGSGGVDRAGVLLDLQRLEVAARQKTGSRAPLDAGEDCHAAAVAELLANAEPLAPAHYSLTIAIMRKHTVKLHGRHCEISVHREGKHVWIAVGDYLGKEIRAQAESEGAAVKRWRETASTIVTTERAAHD